ncbi:MAG: FprA family A-type flavoprotein [Lachnospiraceae bacterium]|nr:FprA family A-type flavoprotein [Lachnospiraceae bacterium]
MKDKKITDSIYYVGADDKTIDLFESQYVVPNGVSYNSYVILDEKIAVMDTVDPRAGEEWLAQIEEVLAGRTPGYLVISHLEPDHAGNIQKIAEKYPDMQLVGNPKTFAMLPQFFDMDVSGRCVTVKEGDTLSLGSHTLTFVMAPMVHWPEVMVAYESSEKVLFSADGFGKFGALDAKEAWVDEARRYYINIVGKYGAQVQALLKKAAALDIAVICPLHGPVLRENLGYYLEKYNTWSSYEPEEKGIVIAYASIHGNTAKAARKLASMLEERTDLPVKVYDLARADMPTVVAEAFRYDRLVLAAASYDGGVFPCMEDFLHHLKAKTYRNRKAGLLENGTWAPSAARTMRGILEEMKGITLCEKVVSIRSTLKESDEAELAALAEELLSE